MKIKDIAVLKRHWHHYRILGVKFRDKFNVYIIIHENNTSSECRFLTIFGIRVRINSVYKQLYPFQHKYKVLY